MLHYIIKILLSAVIITAVSEIAKRSSILGAALASIPLVSVLSIIWFYHDTHNIQQIAELSKNIFWLVLPSLILFIVLPIALLKWHWPFYPALSASIAIMILGYLVMAKLIS
jgi:flagellar biosynthesis protein FlhB